MVWGRCTGAGALCRMAGWLPNERPPPKRAASEISGVVEIQAKARNIASARDAFIRIKYSILVFCVGAEAHLLGFDIT